jgi:hypothetical protein
MSEDSITKIGASAFDSEATPIQRACATSLLVKIGKLLLTMGGSAPKV